MRLVKYLLAALRNTGCALGFSAVLWLSLAGCGRDIAKEASDSDANGYLCTRCGGKFYSARSVFLDDKCRKCGQASLVKVVGYVCPKDNYLTLGARASERTTSAVCEKCQGPLGGIRLPREKELKAWGASKVAS
jgi:ribosomal protein L40E